MAIRSLLDGDAVTEASYRLFIKAEASSLWRSVQRRMFRGIIHALLLERRLGGQVLFTQVRGLMAKFGRLRARRMASLLAVDVDDMADMGRIQDFEDRSMDIDGQWVERGKNRATKHETRCAYADLLVDMPDFCEKVVHGFEEATFRELNPRYRLQVLSESPLLSRGDSHCRFVHELSEAEPSRNPSRK
jgi:hypothetical protein